LYRKLIGTGDIGFVVLNEKGVVVEANTKYARLAGRRNIDHVLGKSILDWTAQHDRDRLSRELAGCLKKGFARSVEIDHTDGQGGTTPVEMNVTCIGTGSGKDLVAFCRDAPKQGHMAGRPRRGTDGPGGFTQIVPFELGRSFFTVLENLPLGIILADRSGTGRYVNRQFTGITGYTLDDVPTEKDWAVRAYPDQQLRKKVVEAWKKNRSPGDTYEAGQRSIACKNGREKVISLRATSLEELTIITLTDATEQRQIESALRHNEDRYRTIYENAIEGIFRAAPDGRFMSANPSHARMLGYDTSEDMVRDITSIGRQLFLEPESHRQFRETLQTHGVVEKFETRLRRRDGGTIWVSLNARTERNSAGEIVYYEGTAEDITDRKLMEDEKRQLEARLRQSEKMEAIGKLAGGIAHDFNNILEVLLGHCGILKMQVPKDGPLQERVRQIADTIEKASSFTKSLLAFSRKQDVVLKPVAINAMVRKSVRILEGLLPKTISLDMALAGGDVTVLADISKIDQVLLNLVANARDAMPQGGRITIRSRTVNLDEDFRRLHGYGTPGRYVLITVTDTGEGIDNEAIHRIFEPFYTKKKAGKGTGLGLAIVYGIVKQHNGYINVSSRPNGGTTFNIYLPAAEGRKQE